MDDLINRQAALDLIENDKIGSGSPFISLPRAQVVNRTCDRHVEGIKHLPSAQRTGRWSEDRNLGILRHRCSECGNLAWKTSAYCPNCGAKMEDDNGAED